MKKLAFATQVFGLMAILPFIVILEMNHTKSEVPESISTSHIKQSTEMISTSLQDKKMIEGKWHNHLLRKPSYYLKAF